METIRFLLIEDIRLILVLNITPILHLLPNFQVITQAGNRNTGHQLTSIKSIPNFVLHQKTSVRKKQYITGFMNIN